MSDAFSIRFDLAAFDAVLDADAEAVEAALRPAAQAGVQLVYDEIKRNVAALGRKTGRLDASIYQAFSTKSQTPGKVVYHASWNHRKAKHGHLIEYGFLQRYVMYQGNDGQVRLMVRPGLEGTPRPPRRASQAEKDAYYVPLPGGPRHVPAKAFVRRAADKLGAALIAAEDRLFAELAAAGVVKP